MIAMLCVRSKQVWVGLVVLVLLLIPVGPLPLAGYIRGFTGDLSVVSFLLLISLYFFPARQSVPWWMVFSFILFGAFFYAYALGVGMTDPYAWGYDSLPMILSVAAVASSFWLIKFYRAAIVLSAAIIAWTIGLHESTNLWDYVIDPYLFISLLGFVIWEKTRQP